MSVIDKSLLGVSAAALAVSGLVASSASAAIVFSDDFESYAGQSSPDIVVTGGYNGQNVIGFDGNSAFTPPSRYLFLDTDRYIDGGTQLPVVTNTTIDYSTGLTAAVDQQYTLDFDVAKNFGTPGDLTYALLVDGVEKASATLNPNVDTVTPIVFSGSAGAVSIRFFGQDDGANGYGQIQIDNITIDATPIPEPGALACMGLGLTLLVRRRSAR